nr:insulinase family protein [Pseudobdellovibrionaceae bacterium]
FKTLFVSFVGPTDPLLIKKNIESVFKDQLKAPYVKPLRKKLTPVNIKNRKYTLIHKEDATDNQIFILFPQSFEYGSPQWYQASLLQQLLGGGLGSALNKTLRVERGLTYGASSRMSGLNFPYWYINTFGGLKQTLPLLKGIDEVLTKFLTTPSEQVLFDSSVEISLNAFQAGRELAIDRIGSQAAHYANHLDYRVIEEYPKKLKNLKKEEVENFKKQLQSKNAAVYLMGNKDFLKKTLLELGVNETDIRVVNKAEIR